MDTIEIHRLELKSLQSQYLLHAELRNAEQALHSFKKEQQKYRETIKSFREAVDNLKGQTLQGTSPRERWQIGKYRSDKLVKLKSQVDERTQQLQVARNLVHSSSGRVRAQKNIYHQITSKLNIVSARLAFKKKENETQEIYEVKAGIRQSDIDKVRKRLDELQTLEAGACTHTLTSTSSMQHLEELARNFGNFGYGYQEQVLQSNNQGANDSTDMQEKSPSAKSQKNFQQNKFSEETEKRNLYKTWGRSSAEYIEIDYENSLGKNFAIILNENAHGKLKINLQSQCLADATSLNVARQSIVKILGLRRFPVAELNIGTIGMGRLNGDSSQ